MSEDAGVDVSVDGGVASITLDRPGSYNSQTPALWARLRAIGHELPGDVRVVLVRGAGRGFSAGLDKAALTGAPLPGGPSLLEMARLPEDECLALIASYQEAFGWLRRPDLISVAVVAGYAIGAGFQLALACDLRVLADDAQLAMAETTLGLVPDLGGTKRLVELVGYGRALEMCVTGRRVGAAEAAGMGLATVTVPRDELDGTVDDLLAALLAPPRAAVTETKALLAGAGGRDQAAQEAAERQAQRRRLLDLAGLGE
jgi:enoyl-CoA hydratase/carnithine racemase